MKKVFVYDPTVKDKQSKTRGVGRYLSLLKENLAEQFSFTDKLDNIPVDSVFINPFYNFLQPPLITKRIAKKQVAIIYDLIPFKYPGHFPIGIKGKLNVFVNKLALKNYDLIVTDSEHAKKDIVSILKVNPNRVKIVYPTLSEIFLNSEFKTLNSQLNSSLLTLNSKFIIYVGDATWNKNLVNLAKAIKLANVTCIFAGRVFNLLTRQPVNSSQINTWEIELNDFKREINNDKRFILLGYVTDKELISLYQKAIANILISRDEGFGFSYLEAASQKCPSVLSNTDIFHETAENTALFANHDDCNDIANKILEFYGNDKLRQDHGNKSYERTKYFSQEKFITGWQKVIK